MFILWNDTLCGAAHKIGYVADALMLRMAANSDEGRQVLRNISRAAL